MRIIHVCESVTGGPASYLNEVVGHQVAKYGLNNIEIICPNDQRDELRVPSSIVRAYDRSGRNLVSLFRLGHAFLKLARSRDNCIVHLHSTYAGFICRLIAKLFFLECKIVYCAHCWYFDRPDNGVRVKLIRRVELFLSKMTDAVINISPHERPMLEGFGFPKSIMHDIFTGIESRDLSNRIKQSDLGFKSNKINLLFVGRFDKQKGIDYLESTLSGLDYSRFNVTVVGKSVVESSYSPRFPSEIKKITWLPREKIFDLMDESHFLLMPSRWEGLSIAVLEALRSGLPVIANDIASFRSLFSMLEDNSKFGIILNFSKSEHIKEFLNDVSSEEWLSMSDCARSFYEGNFTSEMMLKKIDDLYLSLA